MTGAVIGRFMFTAVISRYGCSVEWVSDRGKEFFNDVVRELNEAYWIRYKYDTVYYF